MKLKTLVVAGIFGGLGGFIEISLGSFLHVLRLPFKGLILTGLLIILLIIARNFSEEKGSTLLTGFCIALLKFLFGVGGGKITVVIAISVAAVVMELLFTFAGFNLIAMISGGIICTVYSFLHRILGIVLLSSGNTMELVENAIKKAGKYFEFDNQMIIVILIAVLSVRVIAGAVSGALGYYFVKTLNRKRGYDNKTEDNG